MRKSYLSNIYHAALFDGISQGDIADLTLHGKCNLIRNLVEGLRNKIPQKEIGSGRIARQSLVVIVNSFEPSDDLINFQEQKRGMLFKLFAQDENKALAESIAGWEDLTIEEKEDVLIQTSSLHQRIYLLGTADRIAVNWVFIDGELSSYRRNIKILGGFSGNLSNEFGTTRISKDYMHDVGKALNSVHHETTHAIQFALAVAYDRNRITPSHILYDDARMFHAIEINKAVVPCGVLKDSEQDAYENQVHEVLANSEGNEISSVLIELANS